MVKVIRRGRSGTQTKRDGKRYEMHKGGDKNEDEDDPNHVLGTRWVMGLYCTVKLSHIIIMIVLVGVTGPAWRFVHDMKGVQRDRTVVYNQVSASIRDAEVGYAAESRVFSEYANVSQEIGQRWLEETYASEVAGRWDFLIPLYARFRTEWCEGTKPTVSGNMRFHGSPAASSETRDLCWPLTESEFLDLVVTPPLVDEVATLTGFLEKINGSVQARYNYDRDYMRRYAERVNVTVEQAMVSVDATMPDVVTSLALSEPEIFDVIETLRTFRPLLQVVPGFPFSTSLASLLRISGRISVALQGAEVVVNVPNPLRDKLITLRSSFLDDYDPPDVISSEEIAYLRSLVDVGTPEVVYFPSNTSQAEIAGYNYAIHFSPIEVLAVSAFSLLLFADVLIQVARIMVELGRMRGRQLSKAFSLDLRSSVYTFCTRGGAWAAKLWRVLALVTPIVIGLAVCVACVLLYYLAVVVPTRYMAANGNGLISVAESGSIYSQQLEADGVRARYVANFTNARNLNLTHFAGLIKRYELSVEGPGGINEWISFVPSLIGGFMGLWRFDGSNGWYDPKDDPAFVRKNLYFSENVMGIPYPAPVWGNVVSVNLTRLDLPLQLFPRLKRVMTSGSEHLEFEMAVNFRKRERAAIARRGDMVIYELVTYGVCETLALVFASWILLPALSNWIIDTYVYQAARVAGVPHRVAVELDVIEGGELPDVLASSRGGDDGIERTQERLQSVVKPMCGYWFRLGIGWGGWVVWVVVVVVAGWGLARPERT